MHLYYLYDLELNFLYQRYSNNSNSAFIDQEITTFYLFVDNYQKYFKINDIYYFTF